MTYTPYSMLTKGKYRSSSLSAKAATVAGSIVQHAPKLQGLCLDGRDEFSGKVMAAFKERIRNGYNS